MGQELKTFRSLWVIITVDFYYYTKLNFLKLLKHH